MPPSLASKNPSPSIEPKIRHLLKKLEQKSKYLQFFSLSFLTFYQKISFTR